MVWWRGAERKGREDLAVWGGRMDGWMNGREGRGGKVERRLGMFRSGAVVLHLGLIALADASIRSNVWVRGDFDLFRYSSVAACLP